MRGAFAAARIAAALTLACSQEPRHASASLESSPRGGRIVVGPLRPALTPGLTQQMLAVVQDARGVPRERAVARWTSANPDVASITPGGLVTARMLGTTVLRATYGALAARVTLTVQRAPVTSRELVEHRNVVTTVFWVGEGADASNEFISNAQSAFDSDWLRHFGGVDAPRPRRRFHPAAFTPLENPFYFALPYSDFSADGTRKANASRVIPWAASSDARAATSLVKNRWIGVTSRRTGTTCYAQWQDAGPGVYDDFQYVFGTAPPGNPFVLHGLALSSALDISPAVRDCLGERDGILRVDWRFVPESGVPPGPWTAIVTRRQLSW